MAMYDVVVVGAGVEGSATAYHLAKDGLKTLLLEQFPLPHSRGSSHGQSRITRRAYPQNFYSHMMTEATRFWEELQGSTDLEIYNRVGFLAIGEPESAAVQEFKSALERNGAPYTLLDPPAFRKAYPMLSYPNTCGGLYDPNGGILRADRVVHMFQTLFKRHGGEIRDGQRVLRVTPEADGHVTVRTERHQFASRRVVLCCGPWAAQLTSQLGLTLPFNPVRISVCYFRERAGGSHGPSSLPTFYQSKCVDGHDIYGLPSGEYPGCVKICLHHGPDIDPDRRDAVEDAWVRRSLSQYVQQHFPGLEPTPAVVETCIYTNTPDRHFILDTHPKWKNIIIGAGFSGHGFKLAPVVGRVLSQLAQGKEPSYDLSPFRISRFSPSGRL